MFNKKSYKKAIMTVLALTMILGTVALAAEEIYTKQLTATYGRIKFNYEGSDITSQIEEKYGAPAFVVVDKAYAPVRAIADILGVDIEYDNMTHTAIITDPKAEEHKKQLGEKDAEIEKLKAEVEKLEKNVKEEPKKEEVVANDLASLEKELNRQYVDYKNIEFIISLSKSGNRVNVEITTDFINAKNQYNWGRITSTERKYIVEDIVSQVRKNSPNSDISGHIYEKYNKRYLYSFSQASNGSLNVSIGANSGIYDGGFNDSYVDSRVKSQFDSKGIYDARLSRVNYAATTANFDIHFSNGYMYEWNGLSTSEIESMLDYISSGINYNDYYNDYYNNYYGYGYGYGYGNGAYIRVYAGNELLGTYSRSHNYSSGTFTR